MEKKSKILTFIASDKYFKVWIALFYVFAICVAIYIMNFERTDSREGVLNIILMFLAPVFLIANVFRNKIAKNYKIQEDIVYTEHDEDIDNLVNTEGIEKLKAIEEENTKENENTGKKKRNYRKIIALYIAFIIAIQIVFALIFSLGVDIDMAQSLWVVVLLSGIFYYNYKKYFGKKK